MTLHKPIDYALLYLSLGISILPVRTDASKAPDLEFLPIDPKTGRHVWGPYQDRLATSAEVQRWFSRYAGLGIIGGKVSGNIEIYDFDAARVFEPWADLVRQQLGEDFFKKLLIVRTPRPGYHVYTRSTAVTGPLELASYLVDDPEKPGAKKPKPLIETKGEGGYVLAPGCPADCHENHRLYEKIQGQFSNIPEITPEERAILMACARSLNEYVKEEPDPQPKRTPSPQPPGTVPGTGKRPGDDFNERGDALTILLEYGWKLASRSNGSVYLCRPGKKFGISASFGHVAPNVLYVFSSNAHPFDFGHAYDPFGIFLRLKADGDIPLAVKMLADMGFGEKPEKIPTPPATEAETPIVPPLDDAKTPPDPDIPSDLYKPLPDIPVTEANVREVYGMIALTERNVAMVFEKLYGETFRYCKVWGTWLAWTEARWLMEKTDLPFDAMVRMIHQLNLEMKKSPAKASFAAGAERIAKASRQFATTPMQWDSDTWLFNTPDDTVHLETGERSPHRKTDYITKVTQVAPVEGSHPVFDMFLKDITLNDEGLVDYLQRAIGACLSGAIQDNFLLFWYGTGQNGKNTFGDLIAWILGDYAKIIPTETLISNKNSSHPTTLANLRGLRLAICSEVSEGSYWDEARLKSLTGDTEISARFMNQNWFEFPRTHKHLVYGNHRPMLRIVDPGMKSRLHIVPFKAFFPPEARDPMMRQKLEAEAPAILQWLIDGHMKWLEDGYLKKCSAVQDETDQYFEAQSTNEAWLEECCSTHDDGDESYRQSAGELYRSFKAFKEARGEGVISQTRWGEWMSTRFRRHKAGSVYYIGIELKNIPMTGNLYKRKDIDDE